MARLILTYKNKVLGNHLIAEGTELTIGRHPNNAIVVDNSLVSAHHAKVEHLSSNGLKLTDLNSTNGTYVNHEKVSEYLLAHQDWISIGKHILIVDVYETLSLDATVQMLNAGSSGAQEAEHTMVLDADISQNLMQSVNYLSFLNIELDDFELSNKMITIGRNSDADITISGLWKLLAGEPTATLYKQGADYFVEYVTGMLKPKINGRTVTQPTRIRHHDIIKVGPLKMQLYSTK